MGFIKRISSFLRKVTNNPLYARKVTFAYDGKEILKGINLDVKRKKIVSIIGESGSGKSTFLNLVTGVLTKRHSGDIRIKGKKPSLSKRSLGYVPQEVSVIPDLTVGENISFFGALHGISQQEAFERGTKLLKTLQLDNKINKKPSALSGGEKARVNIIVSLLHDPEVLILDEPFVGLDFYNRRMLWHFFMSMTKAGKSVILTTHLLSEAEKHSDKILILKDGKIHLYGNAEKIKEKLYTQFILEIQFHYLSKKAFEDITEYCRKKTVNILESYGRYMMFSVQTEGQRNYLLKFLKKKKLKFDVLSFREPNMDEVFLGVRGQ